VRELAEECGLAAGSWRRLGSFLAAPAYSTEYVHVLEASDLSNAGAQRLDADEDVVVERCPVEQARARVTDACSLAALALRESATS
jgi:8-oxo-dGTP pyrophosphatase MutT (NUDIX family)